MSENSLERKIKESQKPKVKNKQQHNSKNGLFIFMLAFFMLAFLFAGRIDMFDGNRSLSDIFSFENIRASMPSLSVIEEYNGEGENSSRESLRERFFTPQINVEGRVVDGDDESTYNTQDSHSGSSTGAASFAVPSNHSTTGTNQQHANNNTEENTNIGDTDYAPPVQEETDTPNTSKVARTLKGNTVELEDGRSIVYAGLEMQNKNFKEIDSKCVEEKALNFNAENVVGKEVFVEEYGDSAYVWLGDTLLNQKIIEKGYAFASLDEHKYFYEFQQFQSAAANSKKGIWNDCIAEDKEHEIDVNKSLVINEVKTHSSEFVEIYNPTEEETSLKDYYFSYYSSNRKAWDDAWRQQAFPDDAVIESGGYYLIVLKDAKEFDEYDWSPYNSGVLSASDGTIAIWAGEPGKEGSVKVDALGWGDVHLYLKKPFNKDVSQKGSIARKHGKEDTQNNKEDFFKTLKTTPGYKNYIKKPEEQDPEDEYAEECKQDYIEIENLYNTPDEKYIKLRNNAENDCILNDYVLAYYTKNDEDLSDPRNLWEFPGGDKIYADETYIINAKNYEGGDENWTLLTVAGNPYSRGPFSVEDGLIAIFSDNIKEQGAEENNELVDYEIWGNIKINI